MMINNNIKIILIIIIIDIIVNVCGNRDVKYKIKNKSVIIKNNKVNAIFNSDYSLLQYGKVGEQGIIEEVLDKYWTITFVVANDEYIVNNIGDNCDNKNANINSYGNSVEFYYINCKLTEEIYVNVIANITLINYDMNIILGANTTSNEVGIWDWTIKIGELPFDSMNILRNEGYGVLNQCPSCTFNSIYPQATFQFIAGYHKTKKSNGFYLGAHDKHASAKSFQIQSNSLYLEASISAQVPNAGQSFQTFQMSYPVVLHIYDGDWFDASLRYRQFVFDEKVDWLQKGKIKNRKDTPQYLLDTTVFVNSHWQGIDIFNKTGGDPKLLLERMLNIKKRFQIEPLGLHWYEWDLLGYSNTSYSKCETEITCGFDTHYPEYFPVREGFMEALKAMQAENIKVIPYINGRIFDQNTHKWQHDHSIDYACKDVKNIGFEVDDFSIYNESYGSKAVFGVMCPHTKYWQDVISDVTNDLANLYGTDGVYIDQIAAAGPRSCFDKTHNHTLGGGDYWVSGYRRMLEKVRNSASEKSFAILTESNAEPFMDGINQYLTLPAFERNYAGTNNVLVPVFPSVFGGYFIGMGQIFFKSDFIDTNVFCAKISAQFIYGATIGWFSLIGDSNDANFVGLYETLLDERYDAEISFLKLLSDAKSKVNDFFLFGRSYRSISDVIKINDTLLFRPYYNKYALRIKDFKKKTFIRGLQYSPIMSSTWLSDDEKQLMITLVNVVKCDCFTKVSFNISMTYYGFPNVTNTNVFVVNNLLNGKEILKFQNKYFYFESTIKGRDIILLSVSLQISDKISNNTNQRNDFIENSSAYQISQIIIICICMLIILLIISYFVYKYRKNRYLRGFQSLPGNEDIEDIEVDHFEHTQQHQQEVYIHQPVYEIGTEDDIDPY